MIIIGISSFFHDSAVTLLIDGVICEAVQEERFTRIKHDPGFPIESLRYIFKKYNLNPKQIDYIVFFEKPFVKFERLIETYLAFVPKGFQSFRKAMPIWIGEKLFLKKNIIKNLKEVFKHDFSKIIRFSEHHISHAASAFFPSPYEEALILTIDGVGEWTTTSVALGNKNEIKVLKEINYPHSLGLLYSAFTFYLGFRVNSGEYKVMGLAPYGVPKYKDLILKKLIDLKEDGSFMLDQSYFNYSTGLTMISKKFARLFGHEPREFDSEEITQFHMDISASIQKVLEEIILKICKNLSVEYNTKNICLAGGVALNCVVNSKILKSNTFKNLWVQPAAGDAGGSLGAALALWHIELRKKRKINKLDNMLGSFLGPEFSSSEIKNELDRCGAIYRKYTDDSMIDKISNYLSNGQSVGWFQGRMEFGPRALGGRSIIADPRSEYMQKNLNLKIKFRESFRPFAPSILEDDLQEWFDFKNSSPYMLFVADVKKNKHLELNKENYDDVGLSKLYQKRSIIPAVTHVDYSARIQTVSKKHNKIFHKLLTNFKKLTNCPILLNTSFNIRGEPIVCYPSDAFRCFMGTGLDVLVIGNFIMKKEKQNKDLIIDYKKNYFD
ncbi:carbamoyltransferase [Alphaproteobacteria bacterium]|nr:carbamoyltransferase [Alphaproteobacteria bacterium]